MIDRRTLLGALGASLLWPPGAAAAKPAPAYTPEQIKSPTRISGVVRYGGKAPRPKKVKFSGDCAYCRRFDLREEGLLTGAGGALRNVVVMLEKVRRGKPVVESPTLAELRCTFVPHVLSMTAGGKVRLLNQDPVLNTFHAIAFPSKRTLFNVGLPNKDQHVDRRIADPGVVQMRCDVHPWEEAYVVAVGHPYHCVTDARGAFALDQVPPGRYTLLLWHEKLGARRKPVQVGPGGHLKLELVYPVK